MSQIKYMTNEEVVRNLERFLAPRIDSFYRGDLQGNPRHINVEFCGWSVGFLSDGSMRIETLCDHFKTAFNNSCNPPGFWKKLFLKIKRIFK